MKDLKRFSTMWDIMTTGNFRNCGDGKKWTAGYCVRGRPSEAIRRAAPYRSREEGIYPEKFESHDLKKYRA
jgi:hypothetical protein